MRLLFSFVDNSRRRLGLVPVFVLWFPVAQRWRSLWVKMLLRPCACVSAGIGHWILVSIYVVLDFSAVEN